MDKVPFMVPKPDWLMEETIVLLPICCPPTYVPVPVAFLLPCWVAESHESLGRNCWGKGTRACCSCW